jgi:hypothetical protein
MGHGLHVAVSHDVHVIFFQPIRFGPDYVCLHSFDSEGTMGPQFRCKRSYSREISTRSL